MPQWRLKGLYDQSRILWDTFAVGWMQQSTVEDCEVVNPGELPGEMPNLWKLRSPAQRGETP
jgi:hypothetical protein